jgi:hypothetical protein
MVRRGLAAVALMGVLAGITVAIRQAPGDTEVASTATDPEPATGPPSTGAPTLPGTLDQSAVDAAWSDLPAGPLGDRTEVASAWTGQELIVWGGLGWTSDDAEMSLGDGAAFDPATSTWRPLPPAPGPARAGAVAVWTGDEVLIVGGRDDGTILNDAVAYDPEEDTWRRLPAGPSIGVAQTATWADDRVVVTFVEPEAGGPRGAVATLAPASGTWTTLPSPVDFNRSALVTTGDQSVVLLTGLVDDLNASVRPDVGVHRLIGQDWEAAPAVPSLLPQAFAATAVDDSIVVVDHYRSSAWADPDVSWRPLEPAPTAGSNCKARLVTAGAVAIFSQCGQTAAVDASGQWLPLTPSTGVDPFQPVVVSTGDQLLVWGRDIDAHQPVPVMRSLDLSILH